MTWFGSHSIMAGSSPAASRWVDDPDTPKALYMDVDTSGAKFPRVPSYVTSLWRGPVAKSAELFAIACRLILCFLKL